MAKEIEKERKRELGRKVEGGCERGSEREIEIEVERVAIMIIMKINVTSEILKFEILIYIKFVLIIFIMNN